MAKWKYSWALSYKGYIFLGQNQEHVHCFTIFHRKCNSSKSINILTNVDFIQ